MHWNTGANAGFSPGTPWLPLHHDWLERNVENQESNPGSLLNFYRRLIALRRSEPVLVQGSLELLENMPPGMMAYRRVLDSRSAWIYLNFGKKNRRIAAPEVKINRFFSNQRGDLPAGQTIELLGNEALILISA